MQAPVSVKDKSEFLKWFLNNYQLKKRESVWILNYLINHQDILEHVHFVHDAKFCLRSVIMTTQCSKEVPFRFYKNHLVTTDAEKAFHDIRLNQQESLYIQLNFTNANQNHMYAAVLEENPFVPDDYVITQQDKENAAILLENSLYEFKRNQLLKQIDQSLDEQNREEFNRLVHALQILEENMLNQPSLQEQ
ncbi:ReoY family proteolytic degradation factor [Ornithinibacillus contaminans]|uniref:ReoY family proteolytic degradation factor n=1 Tax=Ornithinibacillus contaminans TaxID=694055 RepID=UPI00064D79B7|nr:ReoY family proteolytic degradation factor [Ornithinibacillus contaminans]